MNSKYCKPKILWCILLQTSISNKINHLFGNKEIEQKKGYKGCLRTSPGVNYIPLGTEFCCEQGTRMAEEGLHHPVVSPAEDMVSETLHHTFTLIPETVEWKRATRSWCLVRKNIIAWSKDSGVLRRRCSYLGDRQLHIANTKQLFWRTISKIRETD